MLILYVQKNVLGGEATSLNRMLLYRDCNLNLLSLSSYQTNKLYVSFLKKSQVINIYFLSCQHVKIKPESCIYKFGLIFTQ